MVFASRVDASIPSSDLLRLTRPRILQETKLDRHAAEYHCQHSQDPDVQYAAALVLDATRQDTDLVELDDARWYAGINSYTLPSALKHAVNQTSFFSDITEVRSPLASLISKVLNSRCQSRKYGTVAEKSLFETKEQTKRYQDTIRSPDWDPKQRFKQPTLLSKFMEDYRAIGVRRKNFRKMILCSLLGNYPHCNYRVSGRSRSILYSLLNEEKQGWFQSLLHGCPSLVVWCVREYLVHALLDDPGLCTQVETVMNFNKFRVLVDRAMNKVRLYINQNLSHTWSQLGKSATLDHSQLCTCLVGRRNKQRGPVPLCIHTQPDRAGQWLSDMTTLLSPFHDAMLTIAYRKPDVSELSFLMGIEVRNRAPLVPRPLPEGETIVEAKEEEESEPEDDGYDSEGDELHKALSKARSLHLFDKISEIKEKNKQSEHASLIDTQVATNVLAYLTPIQFQGLWALVEQSPDLSSLMNLAHIHGGFGVQDEVFDYILTLLQHHRVGSMTKKDRLKQITALHQSEPHAYNLLQVGAELLKEHQSKRSKVVGHLNSTAIESQLAAASRKWDTPGAIEETSVCLYFCAVCDTVYSNARDNTSMFQQYYKYGMRNAIRDYLTDEMYCKRYKVNHRGSCQSTPLTKVNLVGIRYSFDKKVYQLCVGCSDIMVPDLQSCMDDAALGGLLCCDCTQTRLDQLAQQATPTESSLDLQRTCVCCAKVTCTPASTFLYPFGLCLCHRHHSKWIQALVEREMAQGHLDTREQLVKRMRELHYQKRQRARDRAQPGQDRVMRIHRQRSRNKRA